MTKIKTISCKKCGRRVSDNTGKSFDQIAEANGFTIDNGYLCPDCKPAKNRMVKEYKRREVKTDENTETQDDL